MVWNYFLPSHAQRFRFIVGLAVVIIVCSVDAAGEKTVRIPWDGFFARNLSAYNLFADPERQVPNDGLEPYDVITPLFSDYAEKHRFIYLPKGAAMGYRDDGPFDLPVGAALVKTFSYPRDARDPETGRRLVETRLLIHTPEGWKGAAYLWNDEQTDAALKVAGARVPVAWRDASGTERRTDYLVPNMNHCKACHGGFGETAPLGLTARQVNRTYPYAGGARNQLAAWSERGLLAEAPGPGAAPRLAQWDDPDSGTLAERVFGYLDINCAHCHNPEGLASHTRLDLRYTTGDPHQRGVYYRPTAAGNASRGRYYAVVPGDPEASFLLHRMQSTAPNVRMPEVGRTMVHEEGAALIAKWIRALANEPGQ